MPSLLVLIFFLGAACAALAHPPVERRRRDLRDALLAATLMTALWAAIGAEALSVGRHFTQEGVLWWWAGPLPVLALFIRAGQRVELPRFRVRPARERTPALIPCAVLLTFTGVVAALTPPTTWDCLCYHMPRQLFWISNASVEHYAATDLRQLEMPPLAEFIGAQLMLLSGTDHQANLVQWTAYLLGAIAASALARELGARPRAQAFAALLTLANPAAAAQAENPKNDLVVALWALILAVIAARAWRMRRFGPREATGVGVALGLLLLTKGTGYIVAVPLCAIVAAAGLRACGARAIPLGAAAVVAAMALNAPHWWRNYQAFGSPLALPAERGGYPLDNTIHTPQAVLSNLIRNAALHLSTPWGCVNHAEESAVAVLHEALGLDPSDQRTTLSTAAGFTIFPSWFRDGQAGAPVHLVLALALLLVLVRRGKRLTRWPAWPLYIAPFAAWLVFACVLKWQPWHVRLHLPMIALAAAPIAAWGRRRRPVTAAAGLMSSILAAFTLLYNESKPLIGPGSIIGKSRHRMMFHAQPGLYEHARDAADRLAELRPEVLAFDLPGYFNEYATMRTVLDEIRPTPRIVNLRPNYVRGHPEPEPEIALVHQSDATTPIKHEASGRVFIQASDFGRLNLYAPLKHLREVRGSADLPAFFGWVEEHGLRPTEGPYAQFDLPVVRWAYTPVTTLVFQSDGAPATLLAECRRNDRDDQVMTIKLNGETLRRFDFGDAWAFFPFDVTLTPRAGRNDLTFEFANTNEPGPARSALFRRLQIVPSGGG